MKTGYDQFFKKAQKIAAEGHTPPVTRTADRKISSQPLETKALAEELRKRVRPKIQQKRAKKKFPWKLAGISFVGLLIAVVGLLHAEDIENLAKNIEVSFLGTAHAEDAKPAPAAKEAEKAAEAPAPAK
jgi:hypothetical protein